MLCRCLLNQAPYHLLFLAIGLSSTRTLTSDTSSDAPDLENNSSLSVTAVNLKSYYLTDEETALALDVILKFRYVIVPLALLATSCNAIVFLQKSVRSTTSRYIVGISLVQIATLLIDVGYHVLTAVTSEKDVAYLVYGFYFMGFVFIILRRGTYCVMCLVSVERLYAIARPLHIKSFVLVRFPKTSIFAAYAVSILLNIVVVVKVQLKAISVPSMRAGSPQFVTVYIFALTDWYKANNEFVETVSLAAKILFDFVSISVLLIVNVLTLMFLRRYNAIRRSIQSSTDAEMESRRQRQMTVTILGSTACHVLFSLPLAFHSLAQAVDPSYNPNGEDNPMKNFYRFITDFSYLCILFSCFADFVTFALLSSAYRSAFKSVFRLLPAKNVSDHMTVTDSVDD